MLKNWRLIALLISLAVGAVLIIYLFAKEDAQNFGEKITGNRREIPVEGAPTQETLLLSLFHDSIDFGSQMAKLRTEGFENQYFIAQIGGVDSKQKVLTLEMEFPVDGGFETEEKVTSVNCPIETTAVVGKKNMKLLAEKEDIFKWAEKDDLLVSYCLDSTCGAVGKECVLVKMTGNE